MHFIGIDLAWSLNHTEKPETGAVVLDEAGHVLASANLETDEVIVQFVLDHRDSDGGIVGIDAPLVVPNATGRRVCEAALQAVGIPSYPANRTLFMKRFGGVRGEQLVARLTAHGYPLIRDIKAGKAIQACVEVYPRAVIRRMWGAITPYKSPRKAKRDIVRQGLQELHMLLTQQLDPPIIWPELAPSLDLTCATPGELKRHADLLDAALSGYICKLAWQYGPSHVETLGTLADGFIMLPRVRNAEQIEAESQELSPMTRPYGGAKE